MSKSHRIDEIEVLRAIAILFTLFQHLHLLFASPPSWMLFTYSYFSFWSGVDLFFVISGFVITKSFLQSPSSESYWKNTFSFWIRRVFRIFPAAWFWLAIYLLLTWGMNSSGVFGDLIQNANDSLAAVLQVANIYSLQCFGPWHSMHCGPNTIYWSLSLEEQFYLLLPLFFFFVRRARVAWILVLIFVQFFLPRPAWTLGWALRTDGFLWGVLITLIAGQAWRQQLFVRFGFLLKWIKYLIVPMMIVGLALFAGMSGILPVACGLIALMGAGLVLLASRGEGFLMFESPLRTILVWIGSRSYSMYLTHVLVFCGYVELRGSQNGIEAILISLVLIGVISELSYRLIETPTRNWGRSLAKRI